MIRYLVALVLLAAPAFAQVPDDSDWALNGELVNIDLDRATGTATATDASGFSSAVRCIFDAEGNAIRTTAQMETPGGSYRIVSSTHGSKVTKRTSREKSTYMKRVRSKRSSKGARSTNRFVIAPPSGPISSWPLSSPGDEVVSLPFPGAAVSPNNRR